MALLAPLPDERVAELLPARPKQFTAKAVTDRAALLAGLECRSRGQGQLRGGRTAVPGPPLALETRLRSPEDHILDIERLRDDPEVD
jgi:hypothetical protein